MKKIGLVIRDARKEIKGLVDTLISWSSSHNCEIILEKESAKLLNLDNSLEIKELCNSTELIITLGGDGTLIGISRDAIKSDTAILGVKFGNLGFLTETTPDELLETLEDYLNDKVNYAERSMLSLSLLRNNKEYLSSYAVNDLVIQKSSQSGLISLDLKANDEDVCRLRADGVIFSTPTGSTAYSLAAGGSIAHPDLSIILITPICPHSLTNRPLIMPSDTTLKVKVPDHQGDMLISVDGQISEKLKPGDDIIITLSGKKLKFIESKKRSYFEILRTKLNWGLGYES
ncbi:UNVERIFIED_CONTAM: hypothetical protein GTU68_020999 [Idotea baltica]|nr:hypothetical protein [Idotea baltica]